MPDTTVIGAVASAGGLEACCALLRALPDDLTAPIVVVVHLAPDHKSHLPELLRRHTRRPVKTVTQTLPPQPNTVYVVSPNAALRLTAAGLASAPLDPPGDTARTGDRLLTSLADQLGPSAVGVVLSGTGTDGTDGLRAIAARGGLALAQLPSEAAHPDMPASAIQAGVVRAALPIEAIPARIAAWLREQRDAPSPPPPPLIAPSDDHATRPAASPSPSPAPSLGSTLDEAMRLEAIVELIAARVALDLSAYKPSTLMRRAQRRMTLLQIDTLARYTALLHSDAREVELLAQDILVGVTSFLRDPEAFAALRAQVLAPLVARHAAAQPPRPLRLWVPGCSTGEEAYTLAMLLDAAFTASGGVAGPEHVQIFATDVNPQALAVARNGVYPAAQVLAQVPADVVERCFTALDDTRMKVKDHLRAQLTFAAQNVLFDPPFSRLDVITCRNLFIYLKPEAQRRALGLIHFALGPDGCVMLGSSENLPASHASAFDAVSREHRIFRKRPGLRRALPSSLPRPALHRAASARPARALAPLAPTRTTVEALILKHAAPAAVVVDRQLNVLYAHGDVQRFLSYPDGPPTAHLLSALPIDLKSRVQACCYQARERQRRASIVGMLFDRSGDADDAGCAVHIDVYPLDHVSGELLVCFTVLPELRAGDSGGDDDDPAGLDLQGELAQARAEMHYLVGQLERSNEDLRASNEEVLSMNEELQSANEELETSKEELQSMNEELNTVNHQLQHKLAELEEAHDDLANFLRATEIAVVFLDNELRVRRFTETTADLMYLIDGDIGRPLAHISHTLRDVDLVAECAQVLRTQRGHERTAQSKTDRWYLLRLLPYRARDAAQLGVILTLTDITHEEHHKRAAERAARRLAFALKGSPLTVFTQDRDLRYTWIVNPVLGPDFPTLESILGRTDADLGLADELAAFKRDIIATERARTERFTLTVDGAARTFELRAQPTRDPDTDAVSGLLGVVMDVTHLVRLEAQGEARQRSLERRLRASYLESLGALAGGIAHDFNNHLTVMTASLFGLERHLQGRGQLDAPTAALIDELGDALEASQLLARQILAFNQPNHAPWETLSLSDTLRDTLRMLGSFIPDNVALVERYHAQDDHIRAARAQLQQVITNLCHNALQAMPTGGTLTVALEDAPRDAGDGIALTLQDTGVGIPEALKARIFEPFFTTRDNGSGMGLAIVYGIMKSLGGDITVASSRGDGPDTAPGTTFTLWFPHNPLLAETTNTTNTPQTTNTHTAAASSAPSAPSSAPTSPSKPRLAVVDDEPAVLEALTELIKRMTGAEVCPFSRPQDLLDTLARGEVWSGVISDITMPEMSGVALVHAARKHQPALGFVLMSGFHAHTDALHGIERCTFLQKPPLPEQLERAARALLDAAQAPTPTDAS